MPWFGKLMFMVGDPRNPPMSGTDQRNELAL